MTVARERDVTQASTRVEFHNDGLTLVADRWQVEPSRGVVLLLHGGGQTRHSWFQTGGRLGASGWSAVAVDSRGHGESEWDAGGNYSMDALVSDLRAVIVAIGERPVLVGASLGGITSLCAQGENPGLARGLVLVDIVPKAEPAGVKRITDFMTGRPDGFASLQEVADAIKEYNPHRKRPPSLDGLRKNVRQRADGRWYWHWDPAFLRHGDEPARDERVERMVDAAREIRVPTMLVRGKQSDIVSDAGVADLLELVPQATYVDVGDAGHMVAGDDNDVFTENLVEFLDALAPVDGTRSPAD